MAPTVTMHTVTKLPTACDSSPLTQCGMTVCRVSRCVGMAVRQDVQQGALLDVVCI